MPSVEQTGAGGDGGESLAAGARRRVLIAVAAVLAFACALRLQPFVSYTGSGAPLYWDPAVHVARAARLARDGPLAPDLYWGRRKSYPPGFPLLLAGADRARRELGLGGDAVATFYLLNALLTSLPALAAFFAARRTRLGDAGGVAAALVVAASPLEIESSLLGRTPSAIALAATLLAMLVLDTRLPPRRALAVSALAGASLPLVHPPLSFALFLAAMLAWAFLSREEPLARRIALAAAASLALAMPCLLVLGPAWLSVAAHLREVEPRAGLADLAFLASPPTLALVVAGSAGAIALRRERSTRVLGALVLASAGLAAAAGAREVVARALQVGVFALSVQAGLFLWHLASLPRRLSRPGRALAAAAPIGALVASAWPSLASSYAAESRLPLAYLDVLRWIERETEPDATIAAFGRLGWWTPPLTGRTVLIAGVPASAATPEVAGRLAELEDLYTGRNGWPDSAAVLRAHGVDYFVVHPGLPAQLHLRDPGSLTSVYRDDDVNVYRVTPVD